MKATTSNVHCPEKSILPKQEAAIGTHGDFGKGIPQ